LSPDDLVSNIVLLGPGFIFVKVVYLFGEQHKRLDWEWLVWSVLASLPIAGATDVLLSPKLQGPLPFEFVQGTTHFALALVAGSAVAYLWRTHRHNQHPLVRFVRHSLADSAWDVVLDNALRDGCGVAVTVERPNDAGVTTEASYYGRLATFGYETAGAEPIVFLKGSPNGIAPRGSTCLLPATSATVFSSIATKSNACGFGHQSTNGTGRIPRP
jgi:hypothetical protein